MGACVAGVSHLRLFTQAREFWTALGGSFVKARDIQRPRPTLLLHTQTYKGTHTHLSPGAVYHTPLAASHTAVSRDCVCTVLHSAQRPCLHLLYMIQLLNTCRGRTATYIG